MHSKNQTNSKGNSCGISLSEVRQGSSAGVNVLYLGMGYDIISPLNLVPSLDIIYVIDLLDTRFYFCNTLERQRNEMKYILTHGSNDGSPLDLQNKEDNMSLDISYLNDGSATILSEEDSDTVWRLKFIYNGKERNLAIFHQDYFNQWPIEVNNISHIMSMGALLITPEQTSTFRKTVLKMLSERTSSSFYYYADMFDHATFIKTKEYIDGNNEPIGWIHIVDKSPKALVKKMICDF
jgi:hypothetical protein